jgi:hypothetical protein
MERKRDPNPRPSPWQGGVLGLASRPQSPTGRFSSPSFQPVHRFSPCSRGLHYAMSPWMSSRCRHPSTPLDTPAVRGARRRRHRLRCTPTRWHDILWIPHMGGISSDQRSSSPTSPETCAPTASDMGTLPQTMSRSWSAVPRIRTDAARGSRLTTRPPRSERSSHHRSPESLHLKLTVGPAGASCAARDAATKTSRNSSIPSAAIWGATEKSCPCAALVSQRWTMVSNAMRRAHQPTRRPGANHDQHSSSARTLDSCSISDAVPARNHSTNSGESFAGVCRSANRPKSASGRPRTKSATTWCVPATCRATVPTVQRSDHGTAAYRSRSYAFTMREASSEMTER